MDRALSIGELARRSGATTPTIRYYEQIGLLPRPDRREGGHRTFGEADLKRLTFIRRCRDFGFPIEQVRDLVTVMEDPGRSCTDMRDMAQTQLTAVRSRIEELRALEVSLSELVDDCSTRCKGGPGPDCVIVDDLAASGCRRPLAGG